jgi:hypothetical protein
MLKRLLILETQEKDAEATMFTLLLVPVVLPTYMASAFGLDKGVSADIIGTDGLDEKMQRRTLTILKRSEV